MKLWRHLVAFGHKRVMLVMIIFWDISLQMWSAVVVCPQVVYSPSARELKMETVKPAASEKEEDDIDIDAIWETPRNFFFSPCVVALNYESSQLNSWPFPLHLPTPSLPTPTILCFVAWINIVLYLLHINSSYVSSWQTEISRFGIVLTAHFLFLVPIFFQSIKFYYRHSRLMFLYFKGG